MTQDQLLKLKMVQVAIRRHTVHIRIEIVMERIILEVGRMEIIVALLFEDYLRRHHFPAFLVPKLVYFQAIFIIYFYFGVSLSKKKSIRLIKNSV